jgi:hypothetical protein
MRETCRRHMIYEGCTKSLISKSKRQISLQTQLQMTLGNGIVIQLGEILVEFFVACCATRNPVRWRAVVNKGLKPWIS